MVSSTIMEAREEFMVSLSGETKPSLKLAHFLKPSAPPSSINGQKPIRSPPASSFLGNTSNQKTRKISFRGWKNPRDSWKKWAHSMHSLHRPTWERSGICDSVMNSTCEIVRNDGQVLGFARKWCPETKSFHFARGFEVTITLEDMRVLGGYSVLGHSAFSQEEEEEEEEREVIKKLQVARVELGRSKARKTTQSAWLAKFAESRSEIEHEAFLAFWLSRFVFPTKHDVISKHVFPIAVRLARGTRVALAPAVLAGIYRDLGLLNQELLVDSSTELIILSPLQILQVWVWERFPSLRPTVRYSVEDRGPPFARWDREKLYKRSCINSVTDSAVRDFCWRPYDTRGEEEGGRWVPVDNGVGEELEEYVRVLRVSELVGMDGECIEQYLPHRVSMQFGFDQDVPGDVPRANANPDTAWGFYTRPVVDTELYVPSRSCSPNVTPRYLEWRKLNQSTREDGTPREAIRTEVSSEASPSNSAENVDDRHNLSVPPGFSPICRSAQASTSFFDEDKRKASEPIMIESSSTDNSESETHSSEEPMSVWSGTTPVPQNGASFEGESDEKETMPYSKLEARVCKLEKVFAYIKDAKSNHRI